MATNVDSQGKHRGRCSSCACDGYDGGSEKKKCIACGHPPGKHQNLSTSTSVSGSSSGVSSISALSPPSTSTGFCDGGMAFYSSNSDSAVFTPSPVYQCRYPGCQKESDFEPNTGVQSDYCQQHIQYIQMLSQQDGYNSFTTPRNPQWSIGGNTDSSDVASDSSDDQDMSSRVQSDDGSLRPMSAALPSSSSSSSSNWGWASAFSSLLTQRAPSKKTKQQHASPRKSKMQPATPATAQARPVTAPVSQRQVQSTISAMPQATFTQAPQQSITVPQAVPGQPVCKLPGCNRPRYVEPGGKVHDFCGRRHARQYEQQYAPQVPQHLQCATPGCKKQKHPNPNGGYFDYCSLYCRENGLTSASTPNLQTAGFGTCSLPGCNRPKYRDPANGRIHDFCGRSHASQARAQGLQPSNPSMIRQANQQEFSQVSQQFTRDWDPRKGTCPRVDFVYVVSNPALEARWSAYKKNLQNQNVEEYYHGTRLICDLSNMPCTNADCGVCGISNTGLDRRCIRKNINFQRFGHGFYLAPNSSKCHDYTQGAHGYRAMLRCAVCPGRKYTLRTDQVNLKGPPAGYDCVYGQEGSSLNYAEIVVYNPDAVVPRYIIVYQKDGTHKIAK